MTQKITPFLWFDKEAREAAKFYTSVFGGKIKSKQIMKNTPSGTVEVYGIEILGQDFTLMSAGPAFKFNEAISFVVDCKDQKEVDYYWNKLTEKGGKESVCGWLKDKYGVSWQIIPRRLNELISKDKTGRVTQAMLKMKKINVRGLEEAYRKK